MDGSGRIGGAAGDAARASAAEKTASPAKKDLDEKKLRKACADFEAFFIYYMMKTMRQTVPKGGWLGPSAGKDTYTMMMDQKIAESVAKRGDGLGLQKMLLDQMNKKKDMK